MLKVAWSPLYEHPLPAGHRFPMEKYSLIPEQLRYEGTLSQDNFFEPSKVADSVILQTHTQAYWTKLKEQQLSPKEIRRTGFPLSPQLIERGTTIAQGTIDNCLYAFEYGVAMNIAGGTHHAFTDRGEGFCLLNDFGIAANYLLDRGLAERILIVDLDVHQGNGTAEIFRSEPRVFTFSMHCEANYPLQKEQSDLDIGLPLDTKDEEYLGILRNTLPNLIEKVAPDIILYLSGVDILKTDKLGRIACTRAGCKARDRFVFESCYQNNIPVAVSMGGGYSVHIRDIVEAHCNTFRLAQEIWF
ncbi:MAG: histone deacetylase [Bacteroidota bacterium]